MDFHQIILSAAEAVQQTAEVLSDSAAAASETHPEETNVLGTLGINWKLFVAQLVNFSIVLFVFWKWIVKPLGTTLTERQEKIEKGLQYSEAMETEKKKFDDWKTEEMKKVRTEADHVMRTSLEAAEKIKAQTITDAQNQSVKLLEQTRSTIESEKVKMLTDVKKEVADLVVTASEKIIRVKLDANKDEQLITESLKSAK